MQSPAVAHAAAATEAIVLSAPLLALAFPAAGRLNKEQQDALYTVLHNLRQAVQRGHAAQLLLLIALERAMEFLIRIGLYFSRPSCLDDLLAWMELPPDSAGFKQLRRQSKRLQPLLSLEEDRVYWSTRATAGRVNLSLEALSMLQHFRGDIQAAVTAKRRGIASVHALFDELMDPLHPPLSGIAIRDMLRKRLNLPGESSNNASEPSRPCPRVQLLLIVSLSFSPCVSFLSQLLRL